MGQRALITGITGQDVSYLAEFLLEKGYEVHGAVRRVALEDPEHRLVRLSAVRDRIVLHAASLESFASVYQLVAKIVPDECYHLAAQSFVSYSFDDEFSTLNTNINGTHFLLSAVKDLAPKSRFYFAGSSETAVSLRRTRAAVPRILAPTLLPRSPPGGSATRNRPVETCCALLRSGDRACRTPDRS